MKFALSIVAAVCFAVVSANAQNLIVNGDFETGVIAPWAGGTVLAGAGGGFVGNSGVSLTQTVGTKAGGRYLLTADNATAGGFITSSPTVTATPAAGGVPDGSAVFPPTGIPGIAAGQVVMLFIASSDQTVISFNAPPPFPGFVSSVSVDNVSMVEVTPGNLAGNYAGTITTTLAVPEPAVSSKSARKVTARVTAEGEIVLLDGTAAVYVGAIFSNGKYVLTLPGATTNAGTATIRGRRLELTYSTFAPPAARLSGEILPYSITNKLVLTRR